MDIEKEEKDPRKRQSNRDKCLAKAKGARADREELEGLRKGAPSAGVTSSGGQGKGRGKGKSKDQSGMQICYSFANGMGPLRIGRAWGPMSASTKAGP